MGVGCSQGIDRSRDMDTGGGKRGFILTQGDSDGNVFFPFNTISTNLSAMLPLRCVQGNVQVKWR